MRSVAMEEFTLATLGSLALVLVWTAVCLPLGLWLMRRRLVK
jgi:hypothetical protein